MRSKSNGTKQRQRIRRKQGHQNYGTLEARNLLATLVSVDVASGTLSISLDNQNDVAKISVAENLNVTVNGSHDLDTSKAGTQAIDIRQLKHLNITGDSHDKQKAWFDSEFASKVTSLQRCRDQMAKSRTLSMVDCSSEASPILTQDPTRLI